MPWRCVPDRGRVCPECPRRKKVRWRRVPWMMQSLRRCVTDRCVPILNHIQTMDNHISYRCGILGRNPYKSLKRVFLLLILSPLQYSFALWFLFIQTHATSISFCKGQGRKTWHKTIPPSLWFKKSIQKPQVWELSRLCSETWMKLYVHGFGLSTSRN